MKLKSMPIARLTPDPRNPRNEIKPGTKAWDDLEASMKEFGMVQPVIWNERSGYVVGGHQRLRILEAWGQTKTDVVVVDLDDEKQAALNIALNKLGEGNWQKDKLAELLSLLQPTRSLESLGFTKKELNHLLTRKNVKVAQDPDALAHIPSAARSKPGDLYTLVSADGMPQHRLLCGDSRDLTSVQRLVGNAAPRLVFTDPPYGVSYESKSKADGKMKVKKLKNDELRDAVLTDFLTKLFANAAAVSHGEAALYSFYASRTHVSFEEAAAAAGWTVRQQIIWKKQLALGRADYHWNHEPCLYCGRKGKRVEWYGTRKETTVMDTATDWEGMNKGELIQLLKELHEAATVWEVSRDNVQSYIHPTQKPTELARRALRNNTLVTDTVLDVCGGSGSTLIAAELEGRSSFTMEAEPQFVDAIVIRYANVFQDIGIHLNDKEIDPAAWRTTT